MGSRNEELQREITRVALEALEGTGFALAGSGAIREHGVINRLTEDVDLFTSNTDVANFRRAVDQVRAGLLDHGYTFDEERPTDQFARLHVRTGSGEQVDVDMGMDWRDSEPVRLQVGPVLSLDDAIGNKVSALYSRAEARDFLDVDAIRSSGHLTDQQLLTAARERDPGFEPAMFAQQLDRAARITPDRVSEYGINDTQLEGIQRRFESWATQIRRSIPLEQTGRAEHTRGLAY